jgi:hypothetical protein
MYNTKNHNNSNANAIANANNYKNQANLPPPLTLEQVLIMQAQILQTMQQIMANMQQGQGHQQAL